MNGNKNPYALDNLSPNLVQLGPQDLRSGLERARAIEIITGLGRGRGRRIGQHGDRAQFRILLLHPPLGLFHVGNLIPKARQDAAFIGVSGPIIPLTAAHGANPEADASIFLLFLP